MGIFQQVHGELSLILHLPANQKIWRIGLLHQHLTNIFLVAQHPVNGGGAPFRFARYSSDAVSL